MFLKKAFICVREVAIAGYDDVVQNRQIKELSGFLAFVGNQVVVGRGPGGTRRVIVRKDDCGRIGCQSCLEDLLGICYSAGDATGGDAANTQDFVAAVEHNNQEGLAVVDVLPVVYQQIESVAGGSDCRAYMLGGVGNLDFIKGEEIHDVVPLPWGLILAAGSPVIKFWCHPKRAGSKHKNGLASIKNANPFDG